MVHKVIAISEEVKSWLTGIKLCPQESYDNVIRRLRDKY